MDDDLGFDGDDLADDPDDLLLFEQDDAGIPSAPEPVVAAPAATVERPPAPLALYRRYRPDTFEGVIGQNQVTVPLMRALDEGKLTHAYLFSGPRGCGKTSSAGEACGPCKACGNKRLKVGGKGTSQGRSASKACSCKGPCQAGWKACSAACEKAGTGKTRDKEAGQEVADVEQSFVHALYQSAAMKAVQAFACAQNGGSNRTRQKQPTHQ